MNKAISLRQIDQLLADDLNLAAKFLPDFMVDRHGDPLPRNVAIRDLGRLTLREFVVLCRQFADQTAATAEERKDIRFSLSSGAPTAPGWCQYLTAAETWGCPPWEITEDGCKRVWLRRHVVFSNIRAEVRKGQK